MPKVGGAEKSWQLRVDIDYVKSLPRFRIEQPILLVHFGEGGVIAIEYEGKEAHYVLADGNNRLARAFLDGTQTVTAHIVGKEDSQAYWRVQPGLV